MENLKRLEEIDIIIPVLKKRIHTSALELTRCLNESMNAHLHDLEEATKNLSTYWEERNNLISHG